MPESITPPTITRRGRQLKMRLSMASEGRLTAGSVIMSAPAGPAPIPKATIACTMGTSPAVGMTNGVPATAIATIQNIPS